MSLHILNYNVYESPLVILNHIYIYIYTSITKDKTDDKYVFIALLRNT